MKKHLFTLFTLLLFVTPLSHSKALPMETDGTASVSENTNDYNRYALFCIKNDLQVTKKYQRKWGNGTWKTFEIQPGKMLYHSWELQSGSNTHPIPYVRFDSDMQAGEVFSIEYRVNTYLSPDQLCQNAKRYHFVYDGSTRRYVDLRGMN